MFNVFSFDFDSCILYLEDKDIIKSLQCKLQYHTDLQSACLLKQQEYIRIAIICDCIDFIGLSKMIDWDKMGKYKSLLTLLFTEYVPPFLTHWKIKTNFAITQSLQNNFMNLLRKDEIMELVNFTTYRMQHLDLIQNIITHSKINEQAMREYKQFTDNILYQYPYPFMEI